MLKRSTFETGFYAAVLLVILTLTGIFGSFESRDVIEDELTLSTVLLLGAMFGTGYLVARQALKPASYQDAAQAAAGATPERLVRAVLNGIVGALIVAIGLVLLVAFQASVDQVDLRFIFRNLNNLSEGTLVFDQESVQVGLAIMVAVSAVMGAIGGVVYTLSDRIRNTLLIGLTGAVVLGILQGQFNSIMTLPDALLLIVAFVGGYLLVERFGGDGFTRRAAVGVAWGALVGLIVVLLGDVLDAILTVLQDILTALNLPEDFIEGRTSDSLILGLAGSGDILSMVVFVVITAGVGLIGAVTKRANGLFHNAAWYALMAILVLGILNWQRDMNLLAFGLILTSLLVSSWFLLPESEEADERFEALPPPDRTGTRRVIVMATLVMLLVTPIFVGQSITNTLNLMMLYMVMGIGLNVMIGFAGLLDLGYVASFAIGAYTAGLLTTPSLLTCGGMTPEAIAEAGLTINEACTGVMTFWEAWPAAVLVSAFTGMMLGVPVLRLRGDYLAIVTLGFGEIVRILTLSNTFSDLLGGAQGISPIPVPVLDFSIFNENWVFSLNRATEIYYLYLFAVALAAFVVLRLIHTRVGRAWRAMREDEDVAEAVGIRLVPSKLLAFGISSAFAGLGGAIFGASLQGIFPNSFTLLVSVNVLSLVIIGGMGSIPGVLIGALMLIGLPEALRELQDYRLLAFGALLVIAMLLKPEGLLPPQPPRLSEQYSPPQAERRPDPSPQPAGD